MLGALGRFHALGIWPGCGDWIETTIETIDLIVFFHDDDRVLLIAGLVENELCNAMLMRVKLS